MEAMDFRRRLQEGQARLRRLRILPFSNEVPVRRTPHGRFAPLRILLQPETFPHVPTERNIDG